MAKRVALNPDWVKASNVTDIYSVSGCISENFADYIPFWKHNGYWLFDSIEIIRAVAAEHAIDLSGCQFFYYEIFDLEYDDGERQWRPFKPNDALRTSVVPLASGKLEGFDVVSFSTRNMPECSPLSCNSVAESIPVNCHCLLASFEDAKRQGDAGGFAHSEPGPYRVFSVHTCAEPQGPARK